MSTERTPVRSVTIEFRTVFVTISRWVGGPGWTVSMRHRRASNKQPITLRPDEAEQVENVRHALTIPTLRPLPWRTGAELDSQDLRVPNEGDR